MLKNISSRLSSFFRRVGTVAAPARRRVTRVIEARPVVSFAILLLILVGVIVLSNYLRRPQLEEAAVAAEPVVTSTYTVGGAPELMVQAQVEKTGVIRLVALTNGVVQKVHVKEGQRVNRNGRIVSMSSNYQGGNIFSLSRQISQKSYQNTLDTYQLQLDVIETNRQLAEKGEVQAAQLREIARQSFSETRNLITLNEQILTSLDAQIAEAEALSQPDSVIVALQGQKAQVLSGLLNLRSGLRNAEYLNDDSQESAEITRLSRDNTLRQLELQRSALDLSRDIAALNLKIAQVNESFLFPVTPCAGVVERVLVTPGQVVGPGTPLAIIRADDQAVSAVALVSGEVARQVSPLEASTITINDQEYQVTPRSVAQEPTDGTLHAVTYSLPDEVATLTNQGASLMVRIPLTKAGTTTLAVPLDAVYQSQDGAYVLVLDTSSEQPRAISRAIELGDVIGSSVIVTSGIGSGDTVILNRDVVAGDLVKAE